MSNLFYLYPTLKDEHFEKARISTSDIRFYFNDERRKAITGEVKKHEIVYKNDNLNYIELNDVNGVWDNQYDDLIIEQSLEIIEPKLLFGEKGLVSDLATIGVAILWYSRESRQRGSIQVGEFAKKDVSVKYDLFSHFEKAQLTAKLDYSVVFYVKDIDPNIESTHFANEYGLILGRVFSTSIILEGDESTFPIVSIESKEKPLWSVKIGWSNIDEPFRDSVTLRLNKSHKDYSLLNLEERKNFNEPLFKHILINTVSMIIDQALTNNELEEILEAENLSVGSIGYLIKYYLQTYEINTESSITIIESVMKGVWDNG